MAIVTDVNKLRTKKKNNKKIRHIYRSRTIV